MKNIKSLDEFIKENILPKPYKKVKCAECGEDVCDSLNYKIGHLYNKHNCKPSVDDYKAKKMLKQYFPGIVKEDYSPDAGTYGASSIYLDDDEVHMFGMSEYGGKIPDEELEDYNIIVPELVRLLDTDKVSIDGNELWFYDDDRATKRILRKYFDLRRE